MWDQRQAVVTLGCNFTQEKVWLYRVFVSICTTARAINLSRAAFYCSILCKQVASA